MSLLFAYGNVMLNNTPKTSQVAITETTVMIPDTKSDIHSNVPQNSTLNKKIKIRLAGTKPIHCKARIYSTSKIRVPKSLTLS